MRGDRKKIVKKEAAPPKNSPKKFLKIFQRKALKQGELKQQNIYTELLFGKERMWFNSQFLAAALELLPERSNLVKCLFGRHFAIRFQARDEAHALGKFLKVRVKYQIFRLDFTPVAASSLDKISAICHGFTLLETLRLQKGIGFELVLLADATRWLFHPFQYSSLARKNNLLLTSI